MDKLDPECPDCIGPRTCTNFEGVKGLLLDVMYEASPLMSEKWIVICDNSTKALTGGGVVREGDQIATPRNKFYEI